MGRRTSCAQRTGGGCMAVSLRRLCLLGVTRHAVRALVARPGQGRKGSSCTDLATCGSQGKRAAGGDKRGALHVSTNGQPCAVKGRAGVRTAQDAGHGRHFVGTVKEAEHA
eukprot:149727-Chlamydomonas_euryale.AAC.2